MQTTTQKLVLTLALLALLSNFNPQLSTAFAQNSNFTFSASITVSNTYLSSVSAGDVNGDGWPDLVCASQNDLLNNPTNILSIFTNDGTGSLVFSSTVNVDTSPVWVQMADINGNGNLDLISGGNVNNTLTICTNNGAGVFSSNAIYSVAGNPYCFVAADINSDGKPDLIVSTYNNTSQTLNSISVLTNNGSGRFVTSWTFGDYYYARSVAVADFNGDGKPDLAVAYFTYGLVGIYTNAGKGKFAKAGEVNVNGASSYVVAADFNGDGKPDLAVADSLDGNGVTVLTNNGDGTFTQQANYSVGGNPLSLTVADLSGRGRMDIIAANYQSANTVGILTNDGSGGFALEPPLAAELTPIGTTVADFNGDGTPDLAIANGTNTVTVYFGVPIPALFSFNGTNGASPESGLVQTTNGLLYGTTTYGGLYGNGSVYQISTNGIFSSIFSFTNGSDGANPWQGLALGTNGLLYGTAGGGNYYGQYSIYAGVIYNLTTNGVYENLHSFSFPAEGALPGPLVQAAGGTGFFGMTQFGGTNLDAEDQYGNLIGCGTIFRINTNGTFSSIFSFSGTNGAGPSGPLLRGADNHLYGMAQGGIQFAETNTGSIFSGYGTVFKVATNGTSFTNLVLFNGTNGGNTFRNGLAQVADGNIFGTTRSGGASTNGTIFKVSTNGDFTSLYSFTGEADGAEPMCTMVYASDGNLYGTTRGGGSNNLGTIFELGTNGVFTSLFSFNGTNGAYPEGQVLQAKNGNLYVTTVGDQTNSFGTVFTYPLTLTPSIVIEPVNTNVPSGSNASFTVGALGALPLRYQWMSNSVALSKETNATLTLVAVKTNSEANYSVVITNLYGSVTSSLAALTVDGIPPIITNQPQSEIVSNNGTATFTVVASGSPTLHYQWRTNGVSLANKTNATLTLTSIKTNNAGNYTVVVTNLYGSVTSSVAKLTVGSFPPSITSEPANTTTGLGGPASFSVAASGTFALHYHWQRSGTNLADGGEISGSTTPTLTLSSVVLGDATNYSAVITNYYGSTNTSVVTLTINSLFINQQPQNQVVTNGQGAAFSVSVSGAGPIGFQWMKNGVNLTDGGNISGSASSSLTVNPVSLTDEGFYSVEVTNAFTNVVSTAAALSVVLSGTNLITFSSDSTIVLTATQVISSNLTIDGTGHNITISGNNSVELFYVNPTIQLTLRNLTIANGYVNGFGGAISNGDGIVTLDNCTFSNNVATGSNGDNAAGGAIYNSGSFGELFVNNCTFVNNSALGAFGTFGTNGVGEYEAGGPGGPGGNGYGGGIANDNLGSVIITNSTFYNNQAIGGSGGPGGYGYNGYSYQYVCGRYCCSPGIFGCNGYCDEYCTGYYYGGAGGRGGQGGSGFGGSIYNNTGSISMMNTTFASGSASGGPGGSAGINGNFNTGGYGTPGFYGNAFGGNLAQTTGSFIFKNSIVANAAGGGNYSASAGGAVFDGGNNLSSDATLAFTNAMSLINTNPNLGSLANNGGPTLTMALLPASPAVRAGDTNGAPLTDQRGFPRKSLQIDVGAYETQVITSSIPSVVVGTRISSPTNEFQLSFTNTPGTSFSAWSSTNLLLPFTDWTWLGFPREVAPGTFQFNDSNSSTNPRDFYLITSP